jgi:hypothetical protein
MFVNCEKMLLENIKGTVSHDFLLQVFFMNHPQAPENNIRVISNFFQKFAKIFASQGAPLMSTTPVAILPPVPLVLLTPVANLPPVSTTLVANCHRYQ